MLRVISGLAFLNGHAGRFDPHEVEEPLPPAGHRVVRVPAQQLVARVLGERHAAERHVAAQEDRLEVIKYLVTKGKADPNKPEKVLRRACGAWDVGVCACENVCNVRSMCNMCSMCV